MDTDWAGIARAAKVFGGEANLLLLKSGRRYAAEALDEAVPPDDGDGLANGGWFEGPSGWMLMIEGLPEQMREWTERLAGNLTGAGIEGTLTGARSVRGPRWEQDLERVGKPSLSGLFGYRPLNPGRKGPGWRASADALADAVGMGIDWLGAHGGRLMANVDHQFFYWVDAALGRSEITAQATANWVSSVDSYQDERQERRTLSVGNPHQVSLTSLTGLVEWRDTVAELREILRTAPTRGLSLAMVTHRYWTSLLNTSEATYFDRRAFHDHPELWDQFTLDPCGIQILTDQHLAKAHDLTDWTTTRLDEHHYLLQARDLVPWYATPRRFYDPFDDTDLLGKARTDFGGMILTPAIAAELGIASPPS